MKKIINIIFLIFAFVLSFSFVNASVIYQAYQPTFSVGTPSSIYVQGANCQDNSCSSITGGIELFNGDAFITCWDTYNNNNDANQFLSCVDNSKLSGNVIDLSQMSWIVTKETVTSLGSIKQFFASGDSYLPIYSRFENIVCNFDICIDEVPKTLSFVKKDNAIAEIGQLNIMNLDDPLLPVQVQVPVSIQETVCSAFRYTNPQTHKFQPPAGYSDYSANTQITLNIENANTGVNYVTDQKVTIPIQADTCAGLGAFTWTAPSSLENEDIKFTVDTLVIDNQVATSTRDSTSVIETIYPNDLANSCWTRSQDFTLSNIADDFTMTPSVAQITQGEYLYANFRAGAWRGISETAMDYSVEVLVDGTRIYSGTTTSGNVISDFSIDLSNQIAGFSAQTTHTVTLITTPVGSGCLVSESVTQQQDLQILPVDYNTLTVHVSDENGILLDNANINVNLISAEDYFVNAPTYTNTLNTNIAGISTFTNLVAGNYNAVVSKEGYNSVNQNFQIGSNMDLYFTLYENNSAPIIDLLPDYTLFYQDYLDINLNDYISDYNDAFSDLTIEASTTQGVATTQIIGNVLRVSTSQVEVATIRVTVTDPTGESATDTTDINFIANEAPIIVSFSTPFDNGDAAFNTYFVGHVIDAENDVLTCNIDFGDNTPVHESDCSDLNNIAHTFDNAGTYNVVLSVNDEFNSPVSATKQVFVYEVQYLSPRIDSFTLVSSNANHVPSDLTFAWSASHPDNLPITCSLRINGVANDVSCVGGHNELNYDTLGTSTFTIIVTDSNGVQAQRTITQDFITSNTPSVINTFTATPSSGIVPLNTVFNIAVSDIDADILTCTLSYGDASALVTDTCSNLNGITKTYSSVGTYTAILNVYDGVNTVQATEVIIVDEDNVNPPVNNAPVIDTFSATPSSGIVPLNTVFNIAVSDVDADSLTCTLSYGDSSSQVTDTCSSLNGITITKTYSSVGTYIATLSVSDGNGGSDFANFNIVVSVPVNNAPVINTFSAIPNNGIDTLSTIFNIGVSDVDADTLTCTLSYGDGSQIIVDTCSNLNGISKTYSSVGTYSATLSVSDGEDSTFASQTITIVSSASQAPVITDFQVGTSNGNLLPSNLTFTYSSQDPTGLGMSCSINVNGLILNLPTCTGTTTYNNYNTTGSSTFTFSATNSLSTTNLSRTIIFEFPNTVDLSLDMVELNIANEIAPGAFDFNVVILNETLASRELFFTPKIVCNGISNTIDNNNNGILSMSVISQVKREEGFIYYMSSNTQDYKFIVPENTLCRFELNVQDSYGTDFTISSPVIFKLPNGIERIQSIRGSTTDITNYMSSVLSANINKGYNSIEFNVENNDLTQKDLVITMTSRELNVNYNIEISLASGQQRAVLIPLYINENSNKGNYPLRFSVYDGDKKQVRYSYINID